MGPELTEGNRLDRTLCRVSRRFYHFSKPVLISLESLLLGEVRSKILALYPVAARESFRDLRKVPLNMNDI